MPINDGQLDASPRERRLVEERARMKADLKREYIKQWTNPHRMTLDGGYIVRKFRSILNNKQRKLKIKVLQSVYVNHRSSIST